MNIISYDIEEWYIEKKFHGGRKEKYKEFDEYLDRILDTLDANKTAATFFCLGKIASEFPYVVKNIVERGHEIGCHSNEHLWLTKMTPEELRSDTLEAIKTLEDIAGQRVVSYRAPAFSIGEKNKWAVEILAECGIERDSSIFPAERDFGGFATFIAQTPVSVEYNGAHIKEFPISTTNLLGKTIAYSGGGYFRLFPYSFIKRHLADSDYAISYFHIGDLIHNKGGMMSRKDYETYFKEPGTYINRLKRYVKSGLGTKLAFDKMCKLIETCDYTSLEKADEMIDWEHVNKIIL